MDADQLMIALIGPLAVWLSQDQKIHYRKLACIIGLCGQIFWFHTSYTHHEWGIFIASIFYSLSWGKGVKTYWFKHKGD
jgi:hypothetical protein